MKHRRFLDLGFRIWKFGINHHGPLGFPSGAKKVDHLVKKVAQWIRKKVAQKVDQYLENVAQKVAQFAD